MILTKVIRLRINKNFENILKTFELFHTTVPSSILENSELRFGLSQLKSNEKDGDRNGRTEVGGDHRGQNSRPCRERAHILVHANIKSPKGMKQGEWQASFPF